MKKAYYLYLGYYMNLKIFYCTENDNIYAADTAVKSSPIPLSLFTFISVAFYVMGRKMRLDAITFSITPVILFSIILGVMLGVIFSLYTDKKNQEYFLTKDAFKISGEEEWKQLLRQARKITWLYSGVRVFLIFLALIEPFLFLKVKDVILLVGYFVIWFALVWCGLQFRICKRRKMVRNLKKIYD